MFRAWSKLVIVALILAILVPNFVTQAQETAQSRPVSEEDPAFAIEWMTTTYTLMQNEGYSPPAAARVYAYAGITLYESLWGGMQYMRSLVGQLETLPDLSLPEENEVYDWPSVANSALALVISSLVSDASQQTIQDLRDKQQAEREAIAGDEVVATSMAYGETLGEEIVGWIAQDYYTEVRELDKDYVLPTGTEFMWEKTNPDAPIIEPNWGLIRPFVLTYADQCAVYMNLQFSTEPESTFYKQAMEVKEVGDNLTEEQALIASYWVDAPRQTGTPAGHWILIANQVVEQMGLPLDRAAGMYALLGMAVGDSFISAWSLKYQTLLLRPVTYIQRYISRRWVTYVQTPNFPEYPSGHSVVSAASAEVLTKILGTVAFTDNSGFERGFAPRSFTSFEAAASEAAISRLYGGIHYRIGIENGMRQGRCIGQNVTSTLRIFPVRQGE